MVTLLEGAPSQFCPADPAREPEVVPDPRAGPGLAAERLPLQHRGARPLRRPVHGRGQARRAGAHDHHVIGQPGRPDCVSQRFGHLGVGRVHEHSAGVERHHRPGGPGHAQLLKHGPALLGVAAQEAERDVVTAQQVADLVDPGGRILPDHRDRLKTPAQLPPPLLKGLGDGTVELLIRCPGWLRQMELDLPQCGRIIHWGHGGQVPPRDQQPPAGGRVQVPHLRQELRARLSSHPLVGQDQRHAGTLGPQLGQPDQCLPGRGARHHEVMRPVSGFKLARQRRQTVVLVVDDDDHRLRHAGQPTPPPQRPGR